jgi:threonine dehydrogenase-like Zn-dependent dehydrogenase
MKAGRLVATGHVELIEQPMPVPKVEQVVSAIERHGICGSNIHAYHSRPFMHPLVLLGNEFAGRIALLGSAVKHLAEGQRVTVEPLWSTEVVKVHIANVAAA